MYHLSLNIDTLLELGNCELRACCQTHPQGVVGIRKSLVQQQKDGLEFIVPAACSNLGPLGNCQGHDN